MLGGSTAQLCSPSPGFNRIRGHVREPWNLGTRPCPGALEKTLDVSVDENARACPGACFYGSTGGARYLLSKLVPYIWAWVVMIMSRKYIWHRMILYNPPCGTFEVHRYIPWSGNLPPTHLSFIFKGDSTPGLSIWLLVLERSKLRQYPWTSKVP